MRQHLGSWHKTHFSPSFSYTAEMLMMMKPATHLLQTETKSRVLNPLDAVVLLFLFSSFLFRGGRGGGGGGDGERLCGWGKGWGKTQKKKKRKEKGRSRMRDVPALFVVSRCAVVRYQLLWQGPALKAIRPRSLCPATYHTNGHVHFCSPSELRSCVKVEVAALGYPSLIVLMVSVDVKQH